MQKAAVYVRVSTPEQHVETQLYDLRQLAAKRGYEITAEYRDTICGTKSRRPGLDSMMGDAHKRKFSVVLVAAFDRVARSTKHLLALVDELDDLGIQFVSARENIDTSGPMGRLFITLIGSIAELERSLIVERIRAGMRRAKLEGVRLGREPLDVDRDAVARDRLSGMSLTQCAKKHGVSRASVIRFARQYQQQETQGINCDPLATTSSPIECNA